MRGARGRVARSGARPDRVRQRPVGPNRACPLALLFALCVLCYSSSHGRRPLLDGPARPAHQGPAPTGLQGPLRSAPPRSMRARLVPYLAQVLTFWLVQILGMYFVLMTIAIWGLLSLFWGSTCASTLLPRPPLSRTLKLTLALPCRPTRKLLPLRQGLRLRLRLGRDPERRSRPGRRPVPRVDPLLARPPRHHRARPGGQDVRRRRERDRRREGLGRRRHQRQRDEQLRGGHGGHGRLVGRAVGARGSGQLGGRRCQVVYVLSLADPRTGTELTVGLARRPSHSRIPPPLHGHVRPDAHPRGLSSGRGLVPLDGNAGDHRRVHVVAASRARHPFCVPGGGLAAHPPWAVGRRRPSRGRPDLLRASLVLTRARSLRRSTLAHARSSPCRSSSPSTSPSSSSSRACRFRA